MVNTRVKVKKSAENEFPSFVITEDGSKFSVEIPWQSLQISSGPIDIMDPLVIITRVIDLLEVLARKIRKGFSSPKKIKHLKFIDAPGDPLGNLLQKSWQDPTVMYQSFCWEGLIKEQIGQFQKILLRVLLGKHFGCPGDELYSKLNQIGGEYSVRNWKILNQHVEGIINRHSQNSTLWIGGKSYQVPRLSNGEFKENEFYFRITSKVFHLSEQLRLERLRTANLRVAIGKLREEMNNLQQKLNSKLKISKPKGRESVKSIKSTMKVDRKLTIRDFFRLLLEE